MKYLFYLPFNLLMGIAVFLLAPFATAFFSTSDKKQLKFPFRWMMTSDFDLGGDPGWQKLRLWGSDPYSVINRTRWMWRNGGHWFNYNVLGCDGNAGWNAQQDRSLFYWKRPDGYWLYRRFVPIGSKYLELFFGWNLFSIKSGRCKLVCQVRVRSSK